MSQPIRKTRVIILLLVLLFASMPVILSTGPHIIPVGILAPRCTPSGIGLFNLTYYSYWNMTPQSVSAGATIVGDNIVLNATWASAAEVNHTKIIVNATAVPLAITAENDGPSVEINTRLLGHNHTCAINMTAWLVNGTVLSERVQNVFLGNFFTPHIELISPIGGEVWTGVNNITWISWDNNTDEELEFEVLVSFDSGNSFQLLAADITDQYYTWNTTGFLSLNTYMIEVRAWDGIYTSTDRSDEPFSAGEIPVSSSTTTTTPITSTPTTMTSTTSTTSSTTSPSTTSSTSTTSTTTEPTSTHTSTFPTQITAILITSSIIASAFLAVFVYYLARRRM